MGTDIADRATPGAHLIRSFDFSTCEFRDDSADGLFTFEGVASVVDTPYQVRDQFGTFTETIKAGAFDKTLAELTKRAAKGGDADVALFVNHDTRALPLATVSAGNLMLRATPHLAVTATLNPARPSVQEARHAVADGQARQMSIGFSVPKNRDGWNADYTERTISEVALSEASIVWRGASPTTTGTMRSLADLLDLFPEGAEYDEAEVRRAITHLEHLLPAPEVAAIADAILQRDRDDLARLEHKIAARPALTLV
jgi:HK97 family phage prohead protease